MMTASTRARRVAGLAVLAVLCSPALAWAGVDGTWSVDGTNAKKGAYTGTVTIAQGAFGSVKLAGEGSITATKEKFTWTGKGTLKKGKVSFTVSSTSPGLVGGLLGGGKVQKGSGSYTLSADGNTLTGSWKLASSTYKETLTRDTGPATADQLSLVAGGKSSKEDVVPLHRLANVSDTIDLVVKKNAAAGATLSLEIPASVEVLKDGGVKVGSGEKLANADARFKVRGLVATGPEAAAAIQLVVKSSAGKEIARDQVKVHVSRSAFLLSGHGDFEMGSHLKDWLSEPGHSVAGRTNPTIAIGKDEKTQKKVYFAVYFLESDEGARIALSTPDAVVAYHGHSNFGLGYSFKTGFKKISEFFNIADPQMPVNWQYLREHQDHPDLMLDDSEYGDDAATAEFADPIQSSQTVKGKIHDETSSRFPVSGGSGSRLHLTRGKKKFLDHHYGDADNWRIVVKAGSGDMPEKKWSKLLLLSCYSGPYYFNSFGGRGTLFYTHDEALCASEAASVFLEDLISGKSNDVTLKDINKIENLHDYWEFNP